VIVTEPNPVSEGVGVDPTLPVIVVVPVLVMPAYARTAKGAAVPRGGVAAEALGRVPNPASTPATSRAVTASIIILFFGRLLPFFIKFSQNASVQGII
jgi:hypothetical protein